MLTLVAILLGALACNRSTRRLEHIRDVGVLRVAIDPTFAPFEVINEDGHIVGLDADLADEIARRLGVEAHLVTTGYDALYDALTVDRADVIISALYPDPARTGAFAFTRPYFDAGQVLVIREGAPVSEAEDLAGRSVVCIFGTSGHMEALRWEAVLDPPPELVTADDADAAAALLRQGAVEAAIMDHVAAQAHLHGDPSLHIVMPPISSEPYAIAVRREDEELREAVDGILAEMEREGLIAALVETWMQP